MREREAKASAPAPPWHALDAGEAMARLGASTLGLAPEEAARRLAGVGPNALPERRRRGAPAVFLDQFRSPLIYLLLLAAAIAVGLGERRDAAVILAVLLVNAAVGTFQEGRARRSMEALRRLAGLRVRVRRAGREEALEARDLVPGDLLVLSAGDAVGADARLLEASRLATLEAALTGESVPVPKQVEPVAAADVPLADRASLAFAGTHVATGRGLGVVVATGASTEVGRIAALAESAVDARTPLERRLAGLGRVLALGALGVFALVLVVGLLRALPFTAILMVALSQLVSTVPEGLPVAMTVGLAVGMQRMAARRAIVRRLAAVESLGSTTVICTDKTGTLTRNELTAVEAWLPGGRRLRASGAGWNPAGRITEGERWLDAGDPDLAALLRAATLCNDADLHPPGPGEPGWRSAGDPTEAALVVLARKAGLDPARERAAWPRLDEVPFDLAHKMMATAHQGSAGWMVFLKGAPEAVLELCGRERRAGAAVPLDQRERAAAQRQVEAMARSALRVLAFAEAPGVPLGGPDPFAALRGRAVLLGLVGQIDPPRREAPGAVRQCQSAGIRVVMITGDHRDTALAVARELGIAGPDGVAVEGRDLARLPDGELRSTLGRASVFARVEPDQKLRIVEALQSRGEVVAMTGDGVNDAPALVRADVGVAMGQAGTEVAKQASDVVVTDDDFATIVAAVDEGRVVYRNLRKALLLLLSTGLAEILVLTGSLLAGLPLPFAAVQILWNNVVTEGTITVNLAMEPREGDEMLRPPVPRDEPILSGPLLRRMLFLSAAITAVTLGFFAARLAGGAPFERVRTETFVLLAVCEWFNLLNCRSESRSAFRNGLGRNPWLLAGLAVSLALQALVVWWRPLGGLFHTVPLSGEEVGLVVAAGSSVLWAEEARKALARRRERRAAGRRP